jgi:hypothetical protein
MQGHELTYARSLHPRTNMQGSWEDKSLRVHRRLLDKRWTLGTGPSLIH